LCPENKEKYNLTKKELEYLEKEINLERVLKILKQEKIVNQKDTWETIEFYRPKESSSCPKGYKGRIGICEVIEVTSEIREMIISSASTDQIQEKAISLGMITMLEDGIIKAVQGVTSIEEVLRASRE
jgi:type II secretory ATPase GspE/PulE/Tfp pilus assembly ATPase PilB-like protein